MSNAFDVIREKLDSHGSKFSDTRQNHFMATCPAHADKNPSLGVDDRSDHIAIRCYAGCNADDIVAALGMELRDLFDGEPDKDKAIPVRSYVYEALNGSPWFIKDRYYPKTFVQRLPGTDPGDRTGLKGRTPILYHAPRVHRALATGSATVWLVEGEKDVEECERHGLIATCTPGGAGAKWRDEYSQFLRRAQEVVIVADQDQMKPDGTLGSGQQHAMDAKDGLRASGVKVRIVAPAVGKDAYDHFKGGYDVKDFVVEKTQFVRPRGLTAPELEAKEFEPIRWAIEGILPAGLTIFAGSPKVGKSWVSLDMCLAVALGGPALDQCEATQGSALYLAREDTYRRLQSRMRLIMQSTDSHPKGLELIPSEEDWMGGEIGLSNMTEWAEEVGNPGLVVIDTLQKVEPQMGEETQRSGNSYAGNYTMMSRYKQWADDHNCAVVMVHHDRKGAVGAKKDSTEDPFSRISGTRGLTGAADTLWFLESVRGERTGTLHVTGRDVVEQALEMHRVGPLWLSQDKPTLV